MDEANRELYKGVITARWIGYLDKTIGDAKAVADDLFGDGFAPEDAARLIAAPGGCDVRVYAHDDGLSVEATKGTEVQMLRNFRMEPSALIVEHQFSEIAPRRQRIGPRILARAVEEYRKADVRRIVCYASGSPDTDDDGYIVWPILGFNLTFDRPQLDLLEAAGFEARDTHELFLGYDEEGEDNGLDWWARNGSAGHADFDLNPGSVHSEILKTYLEKRGIRV